MIVSKYSAKKDKSACLNHLNIARGKYERRVSSNAAKVLAAAGILDNMELAP